MPFKSKAQARMAEEAAADPNHPEHAYWKSNIKEWRSSTDYKALPERADSPAKPMPKPKPGPKPIPKKDRLATQRRMRRANKSRG
jgi:hypothetical protein